MTKAIYSQSFQCTRYESGTAYSIGITITVYENSVLISDSLNDPFNSGFHIRQQEWIVKLVGASGGKLIGFFNGSQSTHKIDAGYGNGNAKLLRKADNYTFTYIRQAPSPGPVLLYIHL